MHIAIITGASSGLGRAFVQHADQEGLDEIWVIARRLERLQKLQTETKTPLRLLSLDLRQETALQALENRLQTEKPVLQFLVNAAGFGKIGSFADISTSELLSMIDLNCRAAIAITQSAIPFMPPNSHILEICSVAAFQPIPYLSLYAATKALLYRYSLALGIELQPSGISVTAVCPYWIRDTEFIGIAQQTSNSSYIQKFPFASTEAFVARKAWQAAKNNAAVCTPGIMATLDHILAGLLPHRLMMSLSNVFRKL